MAGYRSAGVVRLGRPGSGTPGQEAERGWVPVRVTAASLGVRLGRIAYPNLVGPARSIEILMTTRRSFRIAVRYSSQSGCSPERRR